MNDKNNAHEIADFKTHSKIFIGSKQGTATTSIQQVKDAIKIQQTTKKSTNKE